MYGLSDRLMHLQLIFLDQIQLRTEELRTPNSTLTRPGFYDFLHSIQFAP